MNLIEQLETLRIPDSDFFDISDETRHRYESKNDMLDDCLKIVSDWFSKNSCFNCSNSFVDNEGNLHCMKQKGKIVEENIICKDWN